MNAHLWLHTCINLIYPLHCSGCHRPLQPMRKGALCEACYNRIQLFTTPCCGKCAKPLPDHTSTVYCTSCTHTKNPLDYLIAVGPYQGFLQQLIIAFKYRHNRRLGHDLGMLLTRTLLTALPQETFDMIIPVPVTPQTYAERTFNQAEILARYYATQTLTPLRNNLIKHTETLPQHHCDRSARANNIAGAFAIEHATTIKGKTILLIDDVITTGATLREAAQTLCEADAAAVTGAVIARNIL